MHHLRQNVTLELSWLHTLFVANRNKQTMLKECNTGGLILLKALQFLFQFEANANRFNTIESLLEACSIEKDQINEFTTLFSYTIRMNAFVRCTKLFKCILVNCKEDVQFKMIVLESKFRSIQERRKKKCNVQPLLFRVLVVLFDALNTLHKQNFVEYMLKEIETTTKRQNKVVRLLIVGDGYDQSLAPDKNAYTSLNHPSAEALAPFYFAQNNSDVFLITTNVSAIYEYLQGDFKMLVSGRFADLYGTLFSSITPANSTRDHEHVMHAKKRLLTRFVEKQKGVI